MLPYAPYVPGALGQLFTSRRTYLVCLSGDTSVLTPWSTIIWIWGISPILAPLLLLSFGVLPLVPYSFCLVVPGLQFSSAALAGLIGFLSCYESDMVDYWDASAYYLFTIFPTLWLESSSLPLLYFTYPLIHSSPVL